MASKFFDQSSSSESESDSDNEVVESAPTRMTARAIQKMTYESEDEDKKQRVVLPEKAKRSEEINNLVKQLKNAKKIKDVVKSNQTFEEMVKAYDKCKKLIEKDGHFKQYIRAIAELEQFINELWNDSEWRKSASKNNSAALTKLRQRIKKYNKEFEKEIEDFKANPQNYPEEEKIVSVKDSESEEKSDEESNSEESSSDEDSEEEIKKSRKEKIGKAEESETNSEWSSDESDSSSSDGDIDYDQADIWKKFLKEYTF